MERCTDRAGIYHYLQQHRDRHLYAIGDLSEPFWASTSYYVSRNRGTIDAIVLVYQAGDLPIVMALGENTDALRGLVKELIPTLGAKIYAHISPGCEDIFQTVYRGTYHETQLRMIQTRQPPIVRTESTLVRFGPDDGPRLMAFYEDCYPQHWFDPDMLAIHPFTGVETNGELHSVAGIHTFSREWGSAALGNITTHPEARGRGYAQACTQYLCELLREQVSHIGLNVRADNIAAQRCYQNAGFEVVDRFTEMMLEQ